MSLQQNNKCFQTVLIKADLREQRTHDIVCRGGKTATNPASESNTKVQSRARAKQQQVLTLAGMSARYSTELLVRFLGRILGLILR